MSVKVEFCVCRTRMSQFTIRNLSAEPSSEPVSRKSWFDVSVPENCDKCFRILRAAAALRNAGTRLIRLLQEDRQALACLSIRLTSLQRRFEEARPASPSPGHLAKQLGDDAFEGAGSERGHRARRGGRFLRRNLRSATRGPTGPRPRAANSIRRSLSKPRGIFRSPCS